MEDFEMGNGGSGHRGVYFVVVMIIRNHLGVVREYYRQFHLFRSQNDFLQ